MRAQGHAAVYGRPRLLQHPSWANTADDLVGTGASFECVAEQILNIADEDM